MGNQARGSGNLLEGAWGQVSEGTFRECEAAIKI